MYLNKTPRYIKINFDIFINRFLYITSLLPLLYYYSHGRRFRYKGKSVNATAGRRSENNFDKVLDMGRRICFIRNRHHRWTDDNISNYLYGTSVDIFTNVSSKTFYSIRFFFTVEHNVKKRHLSLFKKFRDPSVKLVTSVLRFCRS